MARSTGSRWRAAGAALLVVIPIAAVINVAGAVAADPADWSVYLHGTGHDSFNQAATSITPANITNLEPVWHWTVPASPNSGSTSLLASPTVVDGVIYIGAKDGMFYALDEATRSIIWSRFLGIDTPKGTCGSDAQGITSTADAVTDPQTGRLTLYVNAPDGYLYALDAATGNIVWQSLVDVPSSSVNDYYAWGTPLVSGGHVYVGISSDCDNPLVPAGLLSFDQSTGAQIAEWHSLPGTQTGASIWSSPVALADGSVITTTGNTLGTNQPLYADSVVRLDGSSLNLLDAWQLALSQQIRDADWGASPTLFTADLGGVSTPMVGSCNKNGIYYAFAQSDLAAGPVWQQRITRAYVGGAPQCDAAAIWDGQRLIEGGGDVTVIGGTSYPGSVRALDPDTGTPLWETGLPGTVLGSPTEDGAGVVAAQIYSSPTGQLGVYLLDASNGSILGFIPTQKAPLYSQPVFAGNDLLVAGPPAAGLTAYEVTTPGPPITGVSPASLAPGATQTETLTGSGFSGQPSVFISGTLVTVRSVKVVSPTTLTFKATATSGATLGARNVALIEPGPTADVCAGCLSIGNAGTPPVPTTLTPPSMPQGEKNVPLVLMGSGFAAGAKVTSASGITVGATYVSPSELDLSLTVAPSVTPGAYNLQVTNTDGGTGTCTGCLTVTSDPAPTVTAVTPANVGQQSTGSLTLTGTDFTTGSHVAFSASGVTSTSVTASDAHTLVVSVSVTSSAALGASDVTVSTPGGTSTCVGCLVVDPHPRITGVSPGLPAGQSTTVVVTGSAFVSGLTVTTTIPGATVGAPFNVSTSQFQVSITVPGGATAGNYVLKVTNPDGGKGSNSRLKVT